METLPKKPLEEVDWAGFVKLFDPSIHAKLVEFIQKDGVEGLIALECRDLSSSCLGDRAACVYGPGCTFTAADLWQGNLTGGLSYERKSMIAHVTRAKFDQAVADGWLAPVLVRTPMPQITKFNFLDDDDEFDFIGPDPLMVSFTKKCRKTGRFHYRDEDGIMHRVGSVTCKVYHVVRESYVTPAAKPA